MRILWVVRLMSDAIYWPVEVEAGNSIPTAIAYLMDAVPVGLVVGLQILAIIDDPVQQKPTHIAPVIPLRRKPSEKGRACSSERHRHGTCVEL